MLTQNQIDEIANEIILRLREKRENQPTQECPEVELPQISKESDLRSESNKNKILVNQPVMRDELIRMKSKTPARIGIGKNGARLKTNTLLTLRADHAAAKDAVRKDVDAAFLEKMRLFTLQTKCRSRDEFLTRPDLGRTFDAGERAKLHEMCIENPDVQIYAADGLSSTAVMSNLENILPAIMDGLSTANLKTGTPFFVKYGRVGSMDCISEELHAKVTCVLLGERPGLATSESMSAYIAYEAQVGMPESRRTVVSNIHARGINSVEAGAYIAEAIEKIYKAKASGVELR